MSFNTAEFIDSLNMFSIRLGLDAACELARRAGNPERSLRFIHLAGTNGKGSVSAMLERSLRESGLRTGLYTSPHLIDVRERFRINGNSVSVEQFNRQGELLAALGGKDFSYFEFATILAMMIFKAEKCDVVIWETGMGGRLDATNIVTPVLSIITNIALDHVDHLGDTTAKIAAEKAGIIKPEVPLVCGRLDDDARKVIRETAARWHAPVYECRAETPASARLTMKSNGVVQHFKYDNRQIALALPGKMQRENFRIVYEALMLLSEIFHFDFDRALQSLDQVRWPGRFQTINSRILLDGGHNPDGTAALAEALGELCPGEKFTTVYAAFADKNGRECVKNLADFTGHFIFTSPGSCSRKSFSGTELEDFASQYNISAEAESDPVAAVEKALAVSERRVVISGSLYLAGEILQKYLPLEQTLNL